MTIAALTETPESFAYVKDRPTEMLRERLRALKAELAAGITPPNEFSNKERNMAKAKKKEKSKEQQPNWTPTIAIARKVLKNVDAGLVSGLGNPVPGQMCVEHAVCVAFGVPNSDKPKCVGAAVRAFKIKLNDARWSSDKARAKGMREVAIAQLGSDQIDQRQFADLVVVGVINKIVPIRLRAVAKLVPSKAEGLEKHATACEAATDRPSARAVARATRDFIYSLDYRYWSAADAYAAATAANADAAAYNAAAAARSKARLEVLTIAAEIGLEALIALKSPGCEWLDLCE